MLVVSYDFTDNKVRAQFSKFLKKYGWKVQYSVYEVHNSRRVLQNILDEVEFTYKKRFKGSDSVIILQVCEGDKRKIRRYGYAKNEEKEVVVFQ